MYVDFLSLLSHVTDQGMDFLKHTLDETHTFQWHTQTCNHLVFGWLVKKKNFGGGGWGMGRIFDDTDVRWTWNSQFVFVTNH